MADPSTSRLPDRWSGWTGATGEARLIACLDRSSSMVRFEKYALVATLYPEALAELRAAAPEALVETWWFAREVTCYAALQPVDAAPTPAAYEYRRALEGGSAISDCLVRALERARELRRERGEAPTRIVIWTDGWNRLARHSPLDVRRAIANDPATQTYLIGFVDRRVQAMLDEFVAAVGLARERVMIFEHEDTREATQRAAYDASTAFGATMRGWR